MRHCLLPAGLLLACLAIHGATHAQSRETLYDKAYKAPDKLFHSINNKTEKLTASFAKQTQKYLNKLKRKEQALKKELLQKDSSTAQELFGDVDKRYRELEAKLLQKHPDGQLNNIYNGRIDSIKTSLLFLQQNPLSASPGIQEKTKQVLWNYDALRDKIDQTGEISKLLAQREQFLSAKLPSFGLGSQLNAFKQDVYYYREQVNEYKRLLDDPSTLEARLLSAVTKIPAFKDFFRKHSELAALFGGAGSGDPAATGVTAMGGLQTRSMVQQGLEQRFGAGVDVGSIVQQNLRSAQSQADQLKKKVESLGSSSDVAVPDFKPNKQKTKSFFRRLEFGTNIQNTRGNSFFPMTSDIGFSVGYKLSDKSSFGIGTSYKMGWGNGIRNIKITHEGIGLRSYVDLQLKGSFFASGGFEYNYQRPFEFQQVKMLAWQQSGLLGISKIVSIKSKVFKKTKVQLLWDFLSYQQVPRTQPVKFRIGYNFK
jgi:hypothetical protein